jgi:hypothetical protein
MAYPENPTEEVFKSIGMPFVGEETDTEVSNEDTGSESDSSDVKKSVTSEG